jgi:hypothetical protein
MLDINDLETDVDAHLSEVGNITSKCKGVTRYHLCLVFSAITFSDKF